MTSSRAALCLVLAVATGCSSSDDANATTYDADATADDADATADGGVDDRTCGPQSCCCKDGVQTSAACYGRSGICAAGWTYNYDDCPFQEACRPNDASVDASTDGLDDADDGSDDTGTRDGDAPHE